MDPQGGGIPPGGTPVVRGQPLVVEGVTRFVQGAEEGLAEAILVKAGSDADVPGANAH